MSRRIIKSRAIVYLDDSRVILKTPYDQEYINEFRDEIPYDSRRWDRKSKMWEVRYPYIEEALEVASLYYELEIHEI